MELNPFTSGMQSVKSFVIGENEPLMNRPKAFDEENPDKRKKHALAWVEKRKKQRKRKEKKEEAGEEYDARNTRWYWKKKGSKPLSLDEVKGFENQYEGHWYNRLRWKGKDARPGGIAGVCACGGCTCLFLLVLGILCILLTLIFFAALVAWNNKYQFH